ncbi:MAG: ABC transporter substrate-binding protein [bacterium]|nr:ABC transporter substrate-binding protein [bacterium]
MIIVRKRLIIWLIRAYLKKWGKVIPLYLLIGVIAFFSLNFLFSNFSAKIPVGQKESIGIVGAYTLDNLPSFVQNDISSGLTSVSDDGTPKPALAKYWKIQDDGKTYVFYLRDNVYFSDGKKLTSEDISYNFSNVTMIKPTSSVIAFKLKDVYAPFLITVSRPIFKKNFIGTGEYKIKNVKLNGNFVQSLTLVSKNNSYKQKTYLFYPTAESLKTSYMLGEITNAKGLSDLGFENTFIEKYPNTLTEKTVNYSKLVTLFFNTKDKTLSDKKVRNALAYAIPDQFSMGERSYAPYSKISWIFKENTGLYEKYTQDFAHARLLLANSFPNGEKITFNLKTLSKYKKAAEEISGEWKKINIQTKIEVVNTVPSSFQIFLGDFSVSKDPDQYTLWHSDQENNITNYKSLRIDKFLEDGRKTIDMNERKKIYADFQKYLMDDSPAAFLYFPYEYEIKRN